MIRHDVLRSQRSAASLIFFGAVVLLYMMHGFLWSDRLSAITSSMSSGSKGLTLSPLRGELDVAPGNSHEGFLRVSNSTDKPMTVNLSAEAFRVINQQYDYAFSPESDVARWVTFEPQDIDLSPGESKNIAYRLGVPLTAEPGGRYISLFASTDTSAIEDGVRSRQRVASLVYLNVLGDVSRTGRLISLSSPWAVRGESKWSVALQNSGTTHFRSRYEVRVEHLFGGTVSASTTGDALVLPGTVRSVMDTLPLPSVPGLYRVVYTIGLGDTPATTEKRLMLYLPPVAIAGVVAASFTVGMIILVRRKR